MRNVLWPRRGRHLQTKAQGRRLQSWSWLSTPSAGGQHWHGRHWMDEGTLSCAVAGSALWGTHVHVRDSHTVCQLAGASSSGCANASPSAAAFCNGLPLVSFLQQYNSHHSRPGALLPLPTTQNELQLPCGRAPTASHTHPPTQLRVEEHPGLRALVRRRHRTTIPHHSRCGCRGKASPGARRAQLHMLPGGQYRAAVQRRPRATSHNCRPHGRCSRQEREVTAMTRASHHINAAH